MKKWKCLLHRLNHSHMGVIDVKQGCHTGLTGSQQGCYRVETGVSGMTRVTGAMGVKGATWVTGLTLEI